MPNIDTYLNSIMIAELGEDVRGSIHDAIEIMNEAVDEGITEAAAMVGAPLVASTASDMEDTTKIYVYTGSETGYTTGDWYYWDGTSWNSGGVYRGNPATMTVDEDGYLLVYEAPTEADYSTDSTLTLPGVPADAKAVGDALADLGQNGGLTDDVKAALLQIASKVAYIDDDGQDYYSALYDALYPPADLSSISCVYTQSGTVYDADTLNSLKSDLVVTAHYDNSTSQVVTNYTLSGTLTEGTSTITVSYGGKTTTFNVTVTHAVTSEVLDTFNKNTMFSQTDLSNVSASNDHLVVSTIKASQVSFTWNTTEAPVFSITIGQYDSSGTPSKLLNHQAYSSSPVTDGSSFDSASWWTNPGTYKWCAIGGGNMTINLPSDGTVKIGLRYGTSGTVVTSNATFWTWLENGGLTITAHI